MVVGVGSWAGSPLGFWVGLWVGSLVVSEPGILQFSFGMVHLALEVGKPSIHFGVDYCVQSGVGEGGLSGLDHIVCSGCGGVIVVYLFMGVDLLDLQLIVLGSTDL